MFDKNEIVIKDDYAEIILYNKKCEEKARTKIDLEDVDRVKDIKWRLSGAGYPESGSPKIKLHQLILGIKEGFITDHKDIDPLNNQKNNLRHCTNSQNQMNQRKRGYIWRKHVNRWMAYIKVNGKQKHLGNFKTEAEAKKARRKAELKYFGEFAPTRN